MASCKNDFLCALIANLQFLEIYPEFFEPIDLDPIISDACCYTCIWVLLL